MMLTRQSFTESAHSGGTQHSGATGDSSSQGDSQSGYSGDSGDGQRQRKGDVRKRGMWNSMSEHVLVTMAPSLGNLQYRNYALTNIKDGGTILQVFVAYMIIGIPAGYMQMFLGQYTHMGVFLIKRMAPIADGTGFSYCITIFFLSMLEVLQIQTMFLYLVLAFVPGDLQWSVCGGSNCWEAINVCNRTESCIDETVHVAAYVYWNETVMSGLSKTEDRRLETPRKEPVIISLGLWIIIYLLSLVSLVRLIKIIRLMTVIHLVVNTATALAILIQTGIVRAFTEITVQSIVNLNYFSAWYEAVLRVIVTMTLGDFSHVMMGALSSDVAKIGTVSFLSGLLSFAAVFIDDVIINSAAIALCDNVNLEQRKRFILYHPGNAPLHLTMMPTTFEILGWPRLWNILYFTNKIMAILFRIIFNIHFLLEAVSHRFPTLSSYKKYSAPTFCALAWGIGIILQGNSAYEIRSNFLEVTMYFCQHFNVGIFVVVVSYVYRVGRFCDDIHFLRRSAPNLYWKTSWMLLPIFLFITLDAGKYFTRQSTFFKERICEIILMFSPYLALTSFEVIKKIVERQTITLFIPEAKWGPREPERRVRRRQFNPRKATRYVMESMHCHHNCIKDNKVLTDLVGKETEIMSRLMGGPQAEGQHGRSSSMEMEGARSLDDAV